jgi:hypothetical protein
MRLCIAQRRKLFWEHIKNDVEIIVGDIVFQNVLYYDYSELVFGNKYPQKCNEHTGNSCPAIEFAKRIDLCWRPPKDLGIQLCKPYCDCSKHVSRLTEDIAKSIRNRYQLV